MNFKEVTLGAQTRRHAVGRESVTVVIPCFNEEASVFTLRYALTELEQQLGLDYDLRFIIVDDASTDNTVWNLRIEFDSWDNVRIIEHEHNEGVAAAIMTGIAFSESEIVASMDFDCSYCPVQFERLLPMLEHGVDLVTASPYHPDGDVRSIPKWRLRLSKAASAIYRVVIRPNLHTYTSCFRVYRRSSVLGLDLRNSGFVGIAEVIWRLDQRGGTVVECPAVLDVRQFGQSKMRVVEVAWGHLRLLAKAAYSRLANQRQDVRRIEPERSRLTTPVSSK